MKEVRKELSLEIEELEERIAPGRPFPLPVDGGDGGATTEYGGGYSTPSNS